MTADPTRDDDKRELSYHRVVDKCILSFQMQFGLSRKQARDHILAFIENEVDEEAYEARRYQMALEQAVGSDSS